MDLLNDLFNMNDLIKQINIISKFPKLPYKLLCSYLSYFGNLELLK